MTAVKLAVAIMSHHSRAARIPGILAGLAPLTPDDVFLAVDYETVGPWPTSRRCWEACPADATHLLVLQDDVILCRDFYPAAVKAVEFRPESPIGFYANSNKAEEARGSGASWFTTGGGMWGQAQMLPVPLIRPMLEFAKNHPKVLADPKCDDWIVGEYLRVAKIKVWFTAPSLVDHACPSDSLIGFNNKNRTARWFIGDRSGLEIDWRKTL